MKVTNLNFSIAEFIMVRIGRNVSGDTFQKITMWENYQRGIEWIYCHAQIQMQSLITKRCRFLIKKISKVR